MKKETDGGELKAGILVIVFLAVLCAAAGWLGSMSGWEIKMVDAFNGLAGCCLLMLFIIAVGYLYYYAKNKMEKKLTKKQSG